MASSISGGVHLGDNDGSPYLSLTVQLGTLPVISLALGPSNSLSLSGGITEGLLTPALSAAMADNILDAVLPPVLAPAVNGGLVDALGALTPLAPFLSNDPTVGGNQLHLGGTQINLPIGIANPWLLS